jgi:hypothetical protein
MAIAKRVLHSENHSMAACKANGAAMLRLLGIEFAELVRT